MAKPKHNKATRRSRQPAPVLDINRPLVPQGKTVGELFHTLIQAQEELRNMFNMIASPKDDTLINLLVARLVVNDDFHKALAKAMFSAVGDVTAQQLSGTIPAAKEQVVEPCPLVSPQGPHAPSLPVVTRDVSVGISPFNGAQGYVEIVLDETGENVAGGLITEGEECDSRMLDPENERDAAIIYAVNQSYTFLRTKADPPVFVEPGQRFYFREVDHTKQQGEGHDG